MRPLTSAEKTWCKHEANFSRDVEKKIARAKKTMSQEGGERYAKELRSQARLIYKKAGLLAAPCSKELAKEKQLKNLELKVQENKRVREEIIRERKAINRQRKAAELKAKKEAQLREQLAAKNADLQALITFYESATDQVSQENRHIQTTLFSSVSDNGLLSEEKIEQIDSEGSQAASLSSCI